MKSLVMSFILAVSFGANAADKIAFEGRDYFLSSATTKQTEVVNHYRARGESLEAWERSLTVQLFKGKSNIDEVVKQHLSEARASLMDDPITTRREGRDDDLVLVMFMKVSDGKSFEYALQRFSRTKEGVMAYRYAHRMPQNADLPTLLSTQSARIEELFALKVRVQEKQ